MHCTPCLIISFNCQRTKGHYVQPIYTISTRLTKSSNHVKHMFMVFETLFSTLSYAREKLKRFSYVTLVIDILSLSSHPFHMHCGFEPESSTPLRHRRGLSIPIKNTYISLKFVTCQSYIGLDPFESHAETTFWHF